MEGTSSNESIPEDNDEEMRANAIGSLFGGGAFMGRGKFSLSAIGGCTAVVSLIIENMV